jgi:acetyl esterase/lipase
MELRRAQAVRRRGAHQERLHAGPAALPLPGLGPEPHRHAAPPRMPLTPEADAPVEADEAAAVTWLAKHLPHTGGEEPGSRPIVLVGHSAGAYIAAMLALDPRWLRGAAGGGERPCRRVAAAVGLAGPYDFLPLESRSTREVFGPGPADASTQPITHADGADPPMLLLTGTDDDVVRPGNTLRLAARLREAGGRVGTRLYDGLGHIRLVAALAAPLRFTAPVLGDIDAFIRETIAAERPGDRC